MRSSLALAGTSRYGNQAGSMTRWQPTGLAGRLVADAVAWIARGGKAAAQTSPPLRLVERIALAPRQSLALIEADGQRLLVATCPDGSPAFYALSAPGGLRTKASRVSW